MLWKTIIITFFAIGVLAEEYNVTDEQREQGKEVLRKMCKRNGAEDKVEDVSNGIKTFIDCVKGLVNVDTIKKEIEEAKPNGALDEVFKKYCEKTPQLKTCINDLRAIMLPCIDTSVREYVASSSNGTDSLIDFVCYKDGDRIALFIAENGPECLTDKSTELQDCWKKIARDGVLTVETSLNIPERCAKFDELATCVVKALEGCSTPTPANMVESMLRYVRTASPCPKKN